MMKMKAVYSEGQTLERERIAFYGMKQPLPIGRPIEVYLIDPTPIQIYDAFLSVCPAKGRVFVNGEEVF